MKEYFVLLLTAVLMSSATAVAEVSVLKGKEVQPFNYENQGAGWRDNGATEKFYFVLDVVPGPPGTFTVTWGERIIYWKEKGPGGKVSYYERQDVQVQALSVVDLGRNDMMGGARFVDEIVGNEEQVDVAVFEGKMKSGLVESMKIYSLGMVYLTGSGDLTDFAARVSKLKRTKKYDDATKTAQEIATDIVDYLESRGYQPEP